MAQGGGGSGGLKSFTLPLSGFVLGSPEYNSSTWSNEKPTGQPPVTSFRLPRRCSQGSSRVLSPRGEEKRGRLPTSWNSKEFMFYLQYLAIYLQSPHFQYSSGKYI